MVNVWNKKELTFFTSLQIKIEVFLVFVVVWILFFYFFLKEYIVNNSFPKLGLAHPKLGMVTEISPHLDV